MQDASVRFVEIANPLSWLLSANSLHEQALHLYSIRGRSALTHIDRNGASVTWDGINKSVFLLCGFALENAIKSFLVYENPHWVSNGKLSRRLRSHSLTSLQDKSALIPFQNRYLWVLEQFEEGIESWARYPCGLSVVTSTDEAVMGHHLWLGYVRLMRAYGLLSREWHGPHGFYGRWTFE